MRSFFHIVAYHLTRFAAKCLFGCVTRIAVLHREKGNMPGPFILAANHISHFDPPVIATIVHRKVDWMAMSEFFPIPVLGRILQAVECFPADRYRADRGTIRTAIDRLKRGRIVGMFPEGGIRDGTRSVLEGAALRPGVSTLAHMAGVAIVPCVILGTDRLYARSSWLPFRRTPIWIGFGDPIRHAPAMERSVTRARAEQALAVAFQDLYAEMRQQFCLTADDLPQSPQARMS
jgi:1-acyl-sn-glycerol-3-phosphate acyltransferase